MLDSFKKILGGNPLADFEGATKNVGDLESEIKKFSDEELRSESLKLKEELKSGKNLEDIKVRAFALVREAAWRTLKQRPYDVQLIGGMVLHKGAVAEMTTG